MRWAARTDGNQQAIADFLRARDWAICIISRVGQGIPDLICARLGFTALAEVKDPTKPKAGQKLTAAQVDFHKSWPGAIVTVYSPDDALTKLNAALVRSGACKLEDVNGLPS